MKKITYILLICAVPWSCTTDFKLTADYKEIMIVWGLLSQNDQTHYLRIQKAFLDENTSALVIAENPDSIYYPDILNVTMEQVGSPNSWSLERIDADTLPEPIKKEAGIFSNSTNILYRFTANLSESASYKLTVQNTITGKTVSATTPMVRDFQITRPATGGFSANFIGSSDFQTSWNVAVNGRLHDLKIIIHYGIADGSQPTIVLKDTFVEIPIFSGKTFSGDNVKHLITKEAFYNGVKAQLDPLPGFVRHCDSLDFVFSVGSIELADYVNFNQAQGGLTSTQISIHYTNIDGGLGLFASRYTKIVADIPLTPGSLDTLACGMTTGDLNFAPNENHPTFPFCN